MAARVAPKRATYQDVLDAPPNMVAEVVGGVLHLHPRPAFPHAFASSALSVELGPPFMRGRGGPGGWVILFEPELHLGPEPDILVPDLAGWREERMPTVPRAAYVTLPPDWLCEVLSESTEDIDRAEKLPIYAREHVGHVWLLDPLLRTLEVLRLDGATYRLVAVWRGATTVRAEPFDAIEIDLGVLWDRVERPAT
ncbi:MAG: Uma2 family endonuclease [Deltaproteobacteria bacterium]|nr:Uma2 family endonuclease [Deltaproteobacteria bacterium]